MALTGTSKEDPKQDLESFFKTTLEKFFEEKQDPKQDLECFFKTTRKNFRGEAGFRGEEKKKLALTGLTGTSKEDPKQDLESFFKTTLENFFEKQVPSSHVNIWVIRPTPRFTSRERAAWQQSSVILR